MKALMILLALGLTACATTHEQTSLDRELALKIVDKLPEVKIHQGETPSYQQAGADDRQSCRTSPVFTMGGQIDHYEKHCFGGE